MSVYAGPEIVNDGLVLCLDAANAKSYPGSGTSWNDMSPNKKVATLTNGPVYSSSNGGYISFDSTDDYAIISDITAMSNISNYTASIWIRIDSSMSGIDCRFFWHGNYGVLIYKTSTDVISVYMRNGTPTAVQPVSSIISFNTWMNITGTFDGVNVKNYINGQLVAQLPLTGTLNAANLPNRFLLGSSINSFWTKCDIANVSIYTKTLTAAEIQQNFNALRGRFGI